MGILTDALAQADPEYKRALQYANDGDEAALYQMWLKYKDSDPAFAYTIRTFNEMAMMNAMDKRAKERPTPPEADT